MGAAYDSSVIDSFIRSRERIPIIDPNNRGSGPAIWLERAVGKTD
jgi:hypothetical protein